MGGLKTKACSNILNSLVSVGAKEVKKNGVFTVPGICRIKTRTKAATKAGTRMAFGQEIKVKAKPARTIVKAFPVAALKKQIWICKSAMSGYAVCKQHFQWLDDRGNPTVRA